MEEILGRMVGPLTVTSDIALHGMVEGDVLVTGGGKLFLYGLVTGDVHIEEAGAAFLHGAVDGAVINTGRYVELFGTAGKDIGFGITHIAPSARVLR